MLNSNINTDTLKQLDITPLYVIATLPADQVFRWLLTKPTKMRESLITLLAQHSV
jgi:hypothetical protein